MSKEEYEYSRKVIFLDEYVEPSKLDKYVAECLHGVHPVFYADAKKQVEKTLGYQILLVREKFVALFTTLWR